MSVGDIIRLNRMYHCPNFEVPTIKSNGNSLGSEAMEAQSSNGNETNEMTDKTSTNDQMMVSDENDMEISNSNHNNIYMNDDDDNNNDDDEDDMILTQEQYDALYTLNAVKRNGLKSAFHHWPMGIVPFEIDPTFCKIYFSFFTFDTVPHVLSLALVNFIICLLALFLERFLVL